LRPGGRRAFSAALTLLPHTAMPTARQSRAGVINCDLGMGKPFDIELERLTSHASYSEIARGVAAGQRGTFFLETFGCQMNDHDSEKVAGLLLSRGYQQVETPEAASRAWVNTGRSRTRARSLGC
jgi:Uncharacterized protein family UPF0004